MSLNHMLKEVEQRFTYLDFRDLTPQIDWSLGGNTIGVRMFSDAAIKLK